MRPTSPSWMELPTRDFTTDLVHLFTNRLQTPAPALYPQGTLALASIYLAIRLPRPASSSSSSDEGTGTDALAPIALPLEPVPWWTHFDATEEELVHVTTMLLSLYRDWGSQGVLSRGSGEGDEPQAKANANADGDGGASVEGVWRRAGRLPLTKSGVREALARIGAGTALADNEASSPANGLRDRR